MIEVENCRGVRAAAKFGLRECRANPQRKLAFFVDTQKEMSPGKIFWHISFEQFFQNQVTK